MTTLCADCLANGGWESPAVTFLAGTALCAAHCRQRASRPRPAQPAPIAAEHVGRVQRLVSPPDRCGALPRIAIGDTTPRVACHLDALHPGMHDDGQGHRWGPLDGPETTP